MAGGSRFSYSLNAKAKPRFCRSESGGRKRRLELVVGRAVSPLCARVGPHQQPAFLLMRSALRAVLSYPLRSVSSELGVPMKTWYVVLAARLAGTVN